jgi:hypothetical protein
MRLPLQLSNLSLGLSI